MSGQTLTAKELGATYGVLFTGYVMGMMMYGFTLFQTYVYYSHYPLDLRVIKTTVGFLWLLDTISFGLISHALYYYLILTYPDAPPLLNFTSTYCAEIGISVLIIFVVQIYYSHRVWIVSQNAVVAVGIAVISFAAFALGIATTGIIAKTLLLSSLATPQGRGVMASSQGLAFLSGVATFTALNFYSSPQNLGIESSRVERLHNTVVTYAVSRGCLAITVQFVYFLTFVSVPTNFFWMPFHLIASKVFLNSLLTTLNVREVHQGHGVDADISSRKTATTSSSSTPHLSSNIRFAVVESKPGIPVRTNVNNATSTKLILDESEVNDWDRKGTGSNV